jgi:hypothetical protein
MDNHDRDFEIEPLKMWVKTRHAYEQKFTQTLIYEGDQKSTNVNII